MNKINNIELQDFLLKIFNIIKLYDNENLFKLLLNKEDFPNYYNIIKYPMCLNIIEEKINNNEYNNFIQFKKDGNI